MFPLFWDFKKNHIRSLILSSFCLLGTLFTYVLMAKKILLAPVPLDRLEALLTEALLPSVSAGEQFIHSFSQSVIQHLV